MHFLQDEKYEEAQTKIKKLNTDKKMLVAVIKTKELEMSELEKKLVSISDMQKIKTFFIFLVKFLLYRLVILSMQMMS